MYKDCAGKLLKVFWKQTPYARRIHLQDYEKDKSLIKLFAACGADQQIDNAKREKQEDDYFLLSLLFKIPSIVP